MDRTGARYVHYHATRQVWVCESCPKVLNEEKHAAAHQLCHKLPRASSIIDLLNSSLELRYYRIGNIFNCAYSWCRRKSRQEVSIRDHIIDHLDTFGPIRIIYGTRLMEHYFEEQNGVFLCTVANCRQTQTSFPSREAVENHIVANHNVTSPFACPRCRETFNTLREFTIHLRENNKCIVRDLEHREQAIYATEVR